jgi:hypothetical protein
LPPLSADSGRWTERFLQVSGAASNGAPRFGFSPEAATPYSLQFNVSVGQQLWNDTVIEVGYVGNRARNQLTHSMSIRFYRKIKWRRLLLLTQMRLTLCARIEITVRFTI